MNISYKTKHFPYMSKTQVSTSENLEQFIKKKILVLHMKF